MKGYKGFDKDLKCYGGWKAAVVDGETIKADTWYMLQDGEFVEATDDED